MGDVVRPRFRPTRRFDPVAPGDLVIGRMLYGDLAGSWVVMKVSVVDADGAIAMVEDGGQDVAVGRILENSAAAPHWTIKGDLITPEGHEGLVGLVAASPEGFRDAFREHAAFGVDGLPPAQVEP